MDGGSGGAPAPSHPPVYSASGLVVGDLVAGGLPPPRTPPVYSAFGLVVGDLVAGGLPPTRKGIILITLSKK